jgi:hypothetical protein
LKTSSGRSALPMPPHPVSKIPLWSERRSVSSALVVISSESALFMLPKPMLTGGLDSRK